MLSIAGLDESPQIDVRFLVPQKRSRRPGSAWVPGGIFAGSGSDAGFGPRTMRLRVIALLTRPKAPSVVLGLAVAAAFIVVETLVVCSLNVVTGTTGRFGTLFLLGVLVVSMVWGLGLSVTMSVASAIAFAYFRSWPTAHFAPFDPQNWMVIGVFLVLALVANALASLARVGERFFDLTPDLLCITDPERVVRVNPAFTQILGYSLDDLAGRPFLDLVVPEDRDDVRALLEQLPGRAEPARFENRVLCRDGSQRWVEWSVVWHRGRAYAVGRDITERRRDQDELHQAQVVAEASRDKLGELAEQQAGLRRVATSVARGASPAAVFAAVCDELAGVLHVVNAGLLRYEPDGTGLVVADQYEPGITTMPVSGERIPLGGEDVGALVLHTRRPARIDDHANAPGPEAERIRASGLGSIVGVPIVVEGVLWGAAIVGSRGPRPLPPDTEARIADFADLVATAIANAATRAELQASRDELSVLAEQQAGLRRVATLVARGVDPSEVFSTVADEMAGCLRVNNASVNRFDGDEVVVLALSHLDQGMKYKPVVGERHTLEGDNIATRVIQAGRSARLDSSDVQQAPGSIAARLREMGLRCAVAVPIVVEGQVWGMAAVGSSAPEPLPPDTEARVGDFADLVATAIANAATRAELVASRARIVAAADDARRRLERDLHDGAQQRLVSLGLQTRLAEASVPPQLDDLKNQLSRVVSGLTDVSVDLQEISRGMHPAILSKGGLGPALKTLARRCTVPVTVDLAIDRPLPDSVEVGAYYIVAEALTNAAKHSRASQVDVCAEAKDDNLNLSIRDDGIGGADLGKGSGLIGLKDRAEALGGQMRILSPAGSGTSLHIAIPLGSE
jgi:PAS domain S-box-containing protein